MRKIIVLMMVVLIVIPSFAQKQKTLKKENVIKEDLKPQKVAPLRQNLILSPEEMRNMHEQELKRKHNIIERELKLEKEAMEKFWKYYVDCEEQKFQANLRQTMLNNDILKKYVDVNKEGKEFDIMMLGEEDASILLKQQMETERRLFDITQKYTDVFREVLTPQQLLKLKNIEQDNNSNMLRQRRMKNDSEFAPSIKREKR